MSKNSHGGNKHAPGVRHRSGGPEATRAEIEALREKTIARIAQDIDKAVIVLTDWVHREDKDEEAAPHLKKKAG